MAQASGLAWRWAGRVKRWVSKEGGPAPTGGGVVFTCGLEPVRPTSCQRRVTSGQAGDKGKPVIKASAAETLWPGCCPGNAT